MTEQQPTIRRSRFSPVIPADWNHDGPPWGVARRDDGRPFRFVLVAIDGDTMDWRVYGLVPLSEQEFAAGERFCPALLAGGGAVNGPDAEELRKWVDEVGGTSLTGAEFLVLTTSLAGPGAQAGVPRLQSMRYDALVNPSVPLKARMSSHEALIRPRREFEELVELCFGLTALPPLDDDRDG